MLNQTRSLREWAISLGQRILVLKLNHYLFVAFRFCLCIYFANHKKEKSVYLANMTSMFFSISLLEISTLDPYCSLPD